MKRLILTTIVALLSCLFVYGQEHILFKGIPLNGRLSSFIQKVMATGNYESETIEGRVFITGSFAGMDNCVIMPIGSAKTNTVWKVGVISDKVSSWSSLKSLYERFKESYSKKYHLEQSFEFFTDPYYEGDGCELLALTKDKCYYVAHFIAPGGNILIQLQASSSDYGRLSIMYEDTINSALDDREREQNVLDDI